jgi:AcrR family transcriptional regulator
MNSSSPRGRRRGKPDTRARILDVARRRFLDGGYRAFTLRAIAAGADVDFALVSYYFGSKKGVLTAVLAEVPNPPAIVDRVTQGDLSTFPERALRTVLDLWDDPETGAPLRALIAGAAHDAAFAAVVKETMQQAVIDKIADRIGGKDARKRAAAFYAQIAGLIGTRYLLCLDPIASMSPDEIIEIYRAPLRLALDTVPQN